MNETNANLNVEFLNVSAHLFYNLMCSRKSPTVKIENKDDLRNEKKNEKVYRICLPYSTEQRCVFWIWLSHQ